MRADWAISRPSVWVLLFTGILCTTKVDHFYVHATVKKNIHFLCLKHLVGLVMAWVSILRKKASVQHIRETLPVSLNNGTGVITYTYSRITKMTIGGIFRNWMILIRLWKETYTTQNVPVLYCDQKKENAPFSSANQTRSMIDNSSIWYNNIDNILTWQKTWTLFDSLRKNGHFNFPVFFMVEYY